MVNKRININELDNVGQLLQQKETLETLNNINSNIASQSKSKKDIDPNLKGWCDCEEITGKETEKKNKKQTKDEAEFDKKQSQINSLLEAGLLIEGQHTPLIEKQKAGEPDTYDKPIRKFKVTSEGEAVLSLAEDLGLVKGYKKTKDLADEVNDDNPNAASEKGNIRTKADQAREDKESQEGVKRTLANQKARKS